MKENIFLATHVAKSRICAIQSTRIFLANATKNLASHATTFLSVTSIVTTYYTSSYTTSTNDSSSSKIIETTTTYASNSIINSATYKSK